MMNQPSLFDSDNSPQPVSKEQVIEPIKFHKDEVGAILTDLVPDDALLALNRGYGIRALIAGRILRLLEDTRDQTAVTRDQIVERLSIPWALVQGTMNVMRKTALVDTKTRITPFGQLALARDPYLDNTGLLWLFHYLLASNAALVLWSNIFNSVLDLNEKITISQTVDYFKVLEGKWSAKTINDKSRHEVGGIYKTYTEDMFSKLGLINKEETGVYQAYSNTATLPPLVWLSILLVYRDRYYPGVSSLEIPLIVKANYSPGRILRQKEVYIRQALDHLHNDGLITVEIRSGLDQIRFKREATWLNVISRHLAEEGE